MSTSSVSRFILPTILVVGSAGFGVFGMPIQMGLFIVVCGVAMAFLNIDKFESVKGAGFEVKVVKGTDAQIVEQHLKVIIEAVRTEMSALPPPMNPGPFGQPANAPAAMIQLEKSVLQRLDARYISVDLSQFGGQKGEWKFLPEDLRSVPELLDQVFLLLPTVGALTYGKQWLLVDQATGTPLKGLDRLGPVSLADAGIKAGARLAVARA